MLNMKLLIFALFCCLPLVLFSQSSTESKNRIQLEQKKLDLKIQEIDSLSREIDRKEVLLDKKVQDSSKTIDFLNSLVGSFGQIFTVLGIFIGIIALALPIVTYQFGIKPSQRALKELEANIDNRLSNYLSNTRNREIEKAISFVKDGTTEEKSKAMAYLSLTYHEGFSDSQLFKIFSVLNKNIGSLSIKSQLSFLLSSQKNDYADILFTKDSMLADSILNQMGYLYFTKTGYKNYLKTIGELINESGNPFAELQSFFFNLSQYSSHDLIEAFDNVPFLDSLNKIDYPNIKDSITNSLLDLNITQELFSNTYFYRKISGSIVV